MFGYPIFPHSSSEFLSDSLTSRNFPFFQLTVDESYDLVSSSSSDSYNSPSSLLSYCTQKQSFTQRSNSSHSLQNNWLHSHFDSRLNEFIDSDSGRVRRAFSNGDSEQGRKSGGRRSESPLWNESNASAIIEGMSRTHRYNPEEKKQRIERYRSKRNLRNFNKKIKSDLGTPLISINPFGDEYPYFYQYTCRKTLADSRPRIRGRFARNEEIGKTVPRVEWRQHVGGDEEDENWIDFLDSLSANLNIP
ncbi:putative leucine-rich repeat receptor-like protein kinase [Hibiscus syriacus]|uniref:Leucine-rich repeat receptor-like protein kinase n=1 Tax=Hibiscus syriacus TaxID=106335 RepID=A0A6A2WXK0_HIBSY|nr:uncharacterized protein LOC120180258 [Hibiscus syriacus]KAE8666672.1 putative leucine-rich repeat receptor-like protein kinase [Hibiscus syriacus]